MAYTAFEDMCRINQKKYGVDGPAQPPMAPGLMEGMDLRSAALRFLRERCEGLRFDPAMAELEKDGNYRGKSINSNQIPYNMQMDVDRLCLEKSLETFFESGVAEDAYNVYYCFLEMFFGRYGRNKKMVELLSEYESNGSSLLMKHRDHYSHSVYVFALGLAVFETNSHFRDAYRQFYHLPHDGSDAAKHAAANHFLEFWGLTSLFHDIGYPFELPFEQVISYFEVRGQDRGPGSLYIAYRDIEVLTKIDKPLRDHLASPEMYGREFSNTNELFAFDITRKLAPHYHFTEESLKEILDRKPTRPETFRYYMDHAFFSAARLLKELMAAGEAEDITKEHVDALTAVLLHNSLFKFGITNYKAVNDPLRMDDHPLAFLLMLCDELQCWDRISYGRNSRRELHPMAADFDFSANAVNAVYYFDSDEQDKINEFKADLKEWKDHPLKPDGTKKKKPRLKDYSDMEGDDPDFVSDIRRIVDTRLIPLSVTITTREADYTSKHTYLSSSSFLHLCDFAVSLNGRYSHDGKEDEVSADQLDNEFESLSLEYKLSNINQVKSFSKYLNAIQCFYTDRPVQYPMLKTFTDEHTDTFGPMEHERWVREHEAMGWTAGDWYEDGFDLKDPADAKASKQLREITRFHKLTMNGTPSSAEIRAHYYSLDEKDRDKDWRPYNSMLKLIKKFDGLRIYQLDMAPKKKDPADQKPEDPKEKTPEQKK